MLTNAWTSIISGRIPSIVAAIAWPLRELSLGIGAVATIDFVGRPETTDLGLSLVKKGGMVIVVGLYGGSLKMSLHLVPMRSITLRGSYVGELRELKELVVIIKSGKIKLIPVKKQDLETANQAMSDLRAGKVNGRIVLVPKLN